MARAVEMLDLVGIPQPKERVEAYPHEFSGGMRQRAMIAMAVINNPDVIIADEPTTALDVTVQAQILEKLMSIKDAINAAIVLITHDLGVVAGMATSMLVMYAGRPVESGTVDEVFYTPADAVHARACSARSRSVDSDGQPLTPDQGRAAVADQPAARLPVLAALPARAGGLPARRAAARRRPTSAEHLARLPPLAREVAAFDDPRVLFATESEA